MIAVAEALRKKLERAVVAYAVMIVIQMTDGQITE